MHAVWHCAATQWHCAATHASHSALLDALALHSARGITDRRVRHRLIAALDRCAAPCARSLQVEAKKEREKARERARKRNQGKKVVVEEVEDDGAGWSLFFTIALCVAL